VVSLPKLQQVVPPRNHLPTYVDLEGFVLVLTYGSYLYVLFGSFVDSPMEIEAVRPRLFVEGRRNISELPYHRIFEPHDFFHFLFRQFSHANLLLFLKVLKFLLFLLVIVLIQAFLIFLWSYNLAFKSEGFILEVLEDWVLLHLLGRKAVGEYFLDFSCSVQDPLDYLRYYDTNPPHA